MTQRIFDTENEKDMTDLWNIVPENIVKIRKGYKSEDGYYINFYDTNNTTCFYETLFLNINWHDKTKITRPKNFKSMIGCVGWFSSHKDAKKDDMIFGILDKYNKNDNLGRCFYCHCDTWYKYFFPAKKCDVKFYGVDKDE